MSSLKGAEARHRELRESTDDETGSLATDTGRRFLAGLVGGTTGAVVTCPIEMLKTRRVSAYQQARVFRIVLMYL